MVVVAILLMKFVQPLNPVPYALSPEIVVESVVDHCELVESHGVGDGQFVETLS